MFNSNHKKIILIVVSVLIVFFLYWYFFISKNDSPDTTNTELELTDSEALPEENPYDEGFVSSLIGLSGISLGTSVFESKTYQALNYPQKPFVINYSTEHGRSNPFLPIGIDSNSTVTGVTLQNVSTSSKSTTTTSTSKSF
jgi:hypothetical protein